MNARRLRIAYFLLGALFAAPLHAAAPADSPDLVVYGGTASGVMTAYSAAREGLHVVLLEPGVHLGGMVTGGLSATDLGHYTIIGGYARDFYMNAAAHYGVHDLDRPENWRSEPHVDEGSFTPCCRIAASMFAFTNICANIEALNCKANISSP